MKIINIRKTESGWVADAYINARAILPVSIPVLECSATDLMEFAAGDPEHDAFADPQPPTEAEADAASIAKINDWLRSDNAAALYGDWSEPSDEYKRMADALRPDPDEPDDLYNYARGG